MDSGMLRNSLLWNGTQYAQKATTVKMYVQKEFTHPSYLSYVYVFPSAAFLFYVAWVRHIVNGLTAAVNQARYFYLLPPTSCSQPI